MHNTGLHSDEHTGRERDAFARLAVTQRPFTRQALNRDGHRH